jgi:hypothetical protein
LSWIHLPRPAGTICGLELRRLLGLVIEPQARSDSLRTASLPARRRRHSRSVGKSGRGG